MKTIRIATNDNVEVMLEGDKRGHKLAACPIAAGEKVIKYGHSIGVATQDIAAGEWVHSHNLKTGLETVEDYAYDPIPCTLEPKIGGSFLGFEREDSGVGIRNELWILPTVGCVAKRLNVSLVKRVNFTRSRFKADAVASTPSPILTVVRN